MHLERHDAVQDGDALAQGVVHLVLGGGHLVAGEERGQRDLGALGRRGDGRVVGDVAVADHGLGQIAGAGRG